MDCLCLAPGTQLLLLIDETTVEVLDPFYLASQALDIRIVTLFYSRLQQRTLEALGALERSALADADAALLAHTIEAECSRFRTKLVAEWRGSSRLGTMPGANLSILEIASRIDYPFVIEQCRKLTLPLLHGRECVITTFDQTGGEYHLRLLLGGIDRIPVQSTGILGPSSWGNIPSGEVFTAPLEESAEGEYLVNGSFATLVAQDAEIVLTFNGGRLVRHRFLITGEPVPYIDELARLSEERGDEGWNVIAELGIGVNNALDRITGNPLVDEKILGTVHIAVGNNVGWQGLNQALVHLDIVTRAPTLAIDGRTIIERGRHVVQAEEFDDLSTYRPHPRFHWPEAAEAVRVASGVAHRANGGLLIELHGTQSGRVTELLIANESTRRLVVQVLKAAGRSLSLKSLAGADAQPLAPELRRKLLSMLWAYGLVEPA